MTAGSDHLSRYRPGGWRPKFYGYAVPNGLPPWADKLGIQLRLEPGTTLNREVLTWTLTNRVYPMVERALFGVFRKGFWIGRKRSSDWIKGGNGELGEAYNLSMRLSLFLLADTEEKMCDCYQRWDDFKYADADAARTHCRQYHSLNAWDASSMDLDDFLKRHVVGVGITRPNGFRKSMLAPSIENPDTGTALQAGRIPRCEISGHFMTQTNQCNSAPEHVCNVTEIKHYSVFAKGTRQERELLRCGHSACKRCFFLPNDAPCPNCAFTGWNPRPIKVWMPIEHDFYRIKGSHGDLHQIIWKHLQSLNDQQSLIIRLRFEEQMSFVRIAEELKLPRNRVKLIYETSINILKNQIDADEEVNSLDDLI